MTQEVGQPDSQHAAKASIQDAADAQPKAGSQPAMPELDTAEAASPLPASSTPASAPDHADVLNHPAMASEPAASAEPHHVPAATSRNQPPSADPDRGLLISSSEPGTETGENSRVCPSGVPFSTAQAT